MNTPQRLSPNPSASAQATPTNAGAGNYWSSSSPQLSSLHHSPASYQQQQSTTSLPNHNSNACHNSSNNFGLDNDSEYTDEEYDDEVDPQEMWSCNLCTFRNHPQLNICEQCENVRIKPGTIRLIRTDYAGAAAVGGIDANTNTTTAAPTNNNGYLEHDGSQNLTQQQQYALHT